MVFIYETKLPPQCRSEKSEEVDMYKNQLQELAQRSCFNLPSYACIRQGPDHAPRFKASVNFNGEIFESPSYCSTLRQAEHAAAEVALNVLSSRGPSRSLTARVLDETGIYKNLLQETAHRAGLSLPVYTTIRSGPGHVPIFTSTVELAGMNFTGEPAKTKKQAEKNAAIAAWSALKNMPNLDSLTNKEPDSREEQDQAVVARVLSGFKPKDDSKQVKRRDHSQTRRRSIKNHRENTSASLPSQRWRLMDMLINAAIDGSTQKQNSFVSLLPPPPPPTTSKILPPTTPRDYRTISVKVKAKSEMKMQENNPLLDEHQRDEEEWLGGKPDVFKKPIEKEVPSSSNSSSLYGTSSVYKPFPFCNIGKLKESMSGNTTRQDATYIGSRLFGSQNPPPVRSIPHPVFNPHSRIAPAVHIRSVIPVCAAPPLRTDPPPSMKETSPSATKASPCSTSVSTQAGEEASLFSQPQKSPTQLSSELNKLQL